MQVEAVVVGGHCAELYPSLILRVGPESQLLFHAGDGLQRYWCVLYSGSAQCSAVRCELTNADASAGACACVVARTTCG